MKSKSRIKMNFAKARNDAAGIDQVAANLRFLSRNQLNSAACLRRRDAGLCDRRTQEKLRSRGVFEAFFKTSGRCPGQNNYIR